jgi:hypothetical protein
VFRIHNLVLSSRGIRQVPHVEQELPTLPEDLSSLSVLSGVRIVRSLVFCVRFCRSMFVFLSFFFWALCCLSFFDLRLPMTPLTSSTPWHSCTISHLALNSNHSLLWKLAYVVVLYLGRYLRKSKLIETMNCKGNWYCIMFAKKSLKMSKVSSEAVNRRRTDSTMPKRKRTKTQTSIYKTLHRKLKIEQYELHLKPRVNSGPPEG